MNHACIIKIKQQNMDTKNQSAVRKDGFDMENAVLFQSLKSKCHMVLTQMGLREKPKRSDVLEELTEVIQQMKNAETRFNLENDYDLVEANIYDMKALQARMRHLLERAKKEKVTGSVLYNIDFEKN